jgi:cytochrome P450
VLADPRFTVAPPGPGGPPGTVAWLRASVSRFAEGPEHHARRALVEAELGRLDPAALSAAARDLALGELARCGRPGDRADVMSVLARRVPLAVLAAQLGLADPLRAAAAVTAVAACYFPGTGAGREPQADAETAWLVTALSPASPELTVARIAIMVQACDATAGLIGTALHLLQDQAGGDQLAGESWAAGVITAAAESWPTEALLAETLRRRPPASKLRRVASGPAEIGGQHVAAGDRVVCDLDAAGLEAQAAEHGSDAAAEGQAAVRGRSQAAAEGRAAARGRSQAAAEGQAAAHRSIEAAAGLAFGAGLRPCPGPHHALALAAGVIDAVRERCVLQPGTPVTYEAAPTRVPERLEVILR